jgi:hypothetical protein
MVLALKNCIKLMAADPYPDSDPAFHVNPDPDPIWIQGFDDRKLKIKNTAYIFFFFF